MGCDTIELFGADVKNERLLRVLKDRYGFSPGAPVIINEFGFNMKVNTIRKTIDLRLRSEFNKFISKLS